MRIKLILLSLFAAPAMLLLFSQTASASSYVSGPSGSQYNGVFLGYPTISFNLESLQQPSGATTYSSGSFSHGSCDSSPYDCAFNPIQGKHTYKIYENEYGDMYYSIDGGSPGKMAGWDIWDSTPYKVLYQGTVTVDINKPTIQLTSPQNNSNTTASSVEVSGQASDANDSGVAYVEVNSYKVSVSSSGNFSTQTNLVKGLNTIEAYAVDNAGRKSEVVKITVFRADSAPTGNSSNVNSSQSTGSDNNNGQQQSNSKTKPETDNSKNVSTPAVISSTNTASKDSGQYTWLRILIAVVVLLCVIGILLKSGIVGINFNAKKSLHFKNFLGKKPHK